MGRSRVESGKGAEEKVIENDSVRLEENELLQA